MRTDTRKPFIDPCYEIETVDDVRQAVREARADARIIFEENGRPPVAVIPLIDLQLLLRLEEQELDRIDVEEIRNEEQAADNQQLIPWEIVRAATRQ